jgi:hypothetical protein
MVDGLVARTVMGQDQREVYWLVRGIEVEVPVFPCTIRDLVCTAALVGLDKMRRCPVQSHSKINAYKKAFLSQGAGG